MTPEQSIREATEAIALIPAADDPRLFDVYLQRARARFALDAAITPESAERVRHDLEYAGRAVASQGGARLLKLEAHRVRPRRLDPLHLALVVPEPRLVERCAEVFGLPLLSFWARTATSDVATEVRGLSSAFREGRLDAPADLVGLAVGTYTAVLGQLASGDKRAAQALLTRYDRMLDAAPGLEPPAPALRYLHGVEALRAIAARDTPAAVACIGRVAARAGADEPLDLMALGLLGLAWLETLDVPPDAVGACRPVGEAVVRAWREVD